LSHVVTCASFLSFFSSWQFASEKIVMLGFMVAIKCSVMREQCQSATNVYILCVLMGAWCVHEMAYNAQGMNLESWQMSNKLSFFLYPFLLCYFLCLLHSCVACFLRLVEVMAPL
jgi:hypothetical protein